LDDYVDHHNVAPKPFIWTAKVMRARAVLNNRQSV
ncbi:MAG: IS630 family transposase, partial [Acidobacteria bacterium]|nr:IS630 family transposase [Acidobacteriota bacterium]